MSSCLSICETCGSILPRQFASGRCPSCGVRGRPGKTSRARFSFPWIADRPEENAGNVPGHYLGDVIGKGGMNEIHRARQISLGRDVAVKIIVEHRRSPEDRDRFLREARFLAQLDHPNIVPIYDYGIDAEDRCFYTM